MEDHAAGHLAGACNDVAVLQEHVASVAGHVAATCCRSMLEEQVVYHVVGECCSSMLQVYYMQVVVAAAMFTCAVVRS